MDKELGQDSVDTDSSPKPSENYTTTAIKDGNNQSTAETDNPVELTANESSEFNHEMLMQQLKREVKCIMEESAIRRCIYEESNYVTALCAVVESCLSANLKRRVLGLFGTTTFALLHKISRLCPAAASVLKKVLHIQQKVLKHSANRSPVFERSALDSGTRYLWLKVALFERQLSTIVDFVFRHAHRYYDSGAMMLHPVYGAMISCLLAGPCALEYSKMKTSESYWTDPCANELVQRHRISGGSLQRHAVDRQSKPSLCDSPSKKQLHIKRNASISGAIGLDDVTQSQDSARACGREYVMSLHQNNRSLLLYGKNNVFVCPVRFQPQCATALKGYLSLHHDSDGALFVKWTPNELMHSGSDPTFAKHANKNSLWQSSLNVCVNDIVYLHYHKSMTITGTDQSADSSTCTVTHEGDGGGHIVLVGADGIQYPPLQFPPGQHAVQFLACLESGLLPYSQLDPPLWLHKAKGKIMPRLHRRSSACSNSMVFGDVFSNNHSNATSNMSSTRSSRAQSPSRELLPSDCNDLVFRIMPVLMFQDETPPSSAGLSKGKEGASPSPAPNGRLSGLHNISNMIRDRFSRLSYSNNDDEAVDADMSPANQAENEEVMLSALVESPSVQNAKECPSTSTTATATCSDSPTHILDGVAAPVERTMSTPNPCSDTPIDFDIYSNTHKHSMVNQHTHDHQTRDTVQSACESMRHQILSRALHGWLAYCRHLKTIRTHLTSLVHKIDESESALEYDRLTEDVWKILRDRTDRKEAFHDLHRIVYAGGMSNELRAEVWPYLLTFIPWNKVLNDVYPACRTEYECSLAEWSAVEVIIQQIDHEQFEQARTREWLERSNIEYEDKSIDNDLQTQPVDNQSLLMQKHAEDEQGSVYSTDLTNTFALNLHRIEKDVHRCDRNYVYFKTHNLDKLKNVMCTYVWEHLDAGYVQGMCDLAAPLLVIFDDEVLTYGCFCKLMQRMAINFPNNPGMDAHLANMRSLLQVVDPELFDLMRSNGDYTNFYFTYRWFLLDFKRELAYSDVFHVWEVIWAARYHCTQHMQLFIALALLITYRDIILDQNMDFTDIIKFFNEMAEKHDAELTLEIARNQVNMMQLLVKTHAPKSIQQSQL